SPTWNQVENGPVPPLKKVPYLHAFAYRPQGTSGGVHLVLVNRHPHETLTVRVALPFSPHPVAERVYLVAPDDFANNESGQTTFVRGPEPIDFQGLVDVPPHALVVYRVKSTTG